MVEIQRDKVYVVTHEFEFIHFKPYLCLGEMTISSSSPSSGDWSSLPSFKSYSKSQKPHNLHSFFSIIPKWRNIRAINSSSCPSPILHDREASTNSPLVEAELVFEQLHTVSDSGKVNEMLCQLFKNAEKEAMGYEEYEKAKKVAEFRPSKTTMDNVTRYLVRSKKWDLILLVCNDFKAYDLLPDRYSCSRLVASCVRASKFRVVRALLQVFKHDGDVAVTAFDSAMRGYNELHMYKSTMSAFDEMVSAGIGPDSGCYCWIMEAYFRKGDHIKVVELFQELKIRQLDLTPLSTQILCQSLAKLGKPLDALEIFRSVSEEGASLDSSKIYSVLIGSFASIRDVKMAEELLKEAENKKMLRDPTVFLRLITMYIEDGLLDKTLEVVKTMKGANIRVSDNICCAIVSGFSRKSTFLDAVKAFEELMSMGCEPGQVTYASVINVYCRLGLYSKAEMVFREMEEKGFDKCVVAYSSMVVLYGKTGRPREAMRLVAKMKQRGCKPNVWIYNSLMDMHGRDGNTRQVAKLWSEMKRMKVAPDKVSYTTLVGAYIKAGDFEMCLKFYNEYRIHGGVLDKAMAAMMVGVFSKSGRVDELVKLLRDMKAEGTGLDVRLYRSALNALADSGLESQVKWWQSSFDAT